MKTPTAPRWPDDYRDWSGTIKDLADTAADILHTLDPGIKAPNIRLLRYYQQSGVVGRGKKQGSQAIFGFEDLERVVAAKGLVRQNWTLDQAVSLMDSHPAPVSDLLYADPAGSPPAQGAPVSPQALSRQAISSAPGAQPSAKDVVARLMAKSGSLSQGSGAALNTSSLASTQGMPLPPSRAPLRAAVPSPSPPAPAPATQPLLGIQAAPWMTVYLDEAAARRASPADRQAAIDALVSALRSLS